MIGWARIAAAAACALALAGGAAAQAVDIELVFAVDSSGSVDAREFALQRQGYAMALVNPEIVRAMTGGPNRAVSVTVFEWSGPLLHNLIVPWTRIDGRAAAEGVAAVLLAASRTIFGGGTAIGAAIDRGRMLFAENPFKGTRRVIDVSGDGVNNRGRPAGAACDEAVAQGITINGLPILEDDPSLETYYRTEVIVGPGAFVMPAAGFADFARAILEKLKLELRMSALPAE
ncbi:MAG: DUF1194 domain-containing protein [Alphaproteobacteria bacterium]|nr:DUF1194 domain-containing protein [Alphaproteobacteria bacterium]